MSNQDLKEKYNEMHTQGQAAWFDDGQAERQAIFYMGEPWKGKTVLEIGCGEGDLLNMIATTGCGRCQGVDYSIEAVEIAHNVYPDLAIANITWQDFSLLDEYYDVLVMQGVMEHLDDPFNELADMIERFKPKTVITSMPNHANIRGILWKYTKLLGGVPSKTDLHEISAPDVWKFCSEHGYKLKRRSIEYEWGMGCCWDNYESKMTRDLRQRLPLALKDGNLKFDPVELDKFITWLDGLQLSSNQHSGAVNIYRIDI